MKNQLLIFVLFFISTATNAQTIYLSTLDNLLFRLNINSCQYEQVVEIQLPNSGGVTDISFHPNRTLYGIDYGGHFFEIDTITGVTNQIHQFTRNQTYNSLTIADNGLIYATGGKSLMSYDLVSGNEINHGLMPFSASGDLTFYNGDLYLAATGNRILKVDIDNPSNSEVIIDDERNFEIYGIVTYIDDCRIIKTYAISDQNSKIYEINFTNNTLNLVCELPIQVGGGASTFEFLGASAAINIQEMAMINSDCQELNGSILIDAVADTGTISFSIDGVNFQSTGVFENLAAGDYTVTINNDIGCPIFRYFTLDDGNSTIITSVRHGDTECSEANGFIVVNANGGTGKLQYSLDQFNYQTDNTFRDLDYGAYQISIIDEKNCIVDTVVNILQGGCDIFIPNAFSPNNDGINDLFKIYPHSAFLGKITTFKIFDRWGGIVFEASNFDFFDTAWDGTYRGETAASGVYVYFVEVEMENGKKELLKGDVTLLR